MKAWAIELSSKESRIRRIYCILASDEHEALGKAFAQLHWDLVKEKKDEDTTDYAADLWNSTEIPASFPVSSPPPPPPPPVDTSSSFDEQLKQAQERK